MKRDLSDKDKLLEEKDREIHRLRSDLSEVTNSL